VGLAVGLFVLTLGLQWSSGAYQSEFGAHADEPAHVVTGLMVRDYLAEGLWQGQSPMAFAQAYYDRYPKVALGHYPPAFYLVEGVWLLPVRSPAAVLVLMAVLCTAAALLTWRLARSQGLHPVPALLAAALFVLHPLVRTYTNIVMSDLLLIIFCLLATDAWRRFLGSTKTRDSLWFGLWAAAAILTKGSGLFLALVPPLSIALTGKWRLLKCRALWLAVVPVILFAMPWMLATRHITAEGMSSTPLSEYIPQACSFFAKHLPAEFGWLAGLLLLCAVLEAIRRAILRRSVDDSTACLVAFAVGLLALYLVIPAGLDSRYLLPLAPIIFILGIDFVHRLTIHFTRKLSESQRATAVATAFVILATVILLESLRPVQKQFSGYGAVLDSILEDHQSNATPPADGEFIDVLIASNANGEGAVVAAAAFRPEAPLKIHRSTKVLIDTDWLGRDPKVRFQPGAEADERFRQLSMEWVLLEQVLGPFQMDVAWHILQTRGTAFTKALNDPYPLQHKDGFPGDLYRLRWLH
jgi:hypothetical protein